MKECEGKLAGLMQPAVDQIVHMCLESGLAVKRHILGRNCGIHPSNRARSGVDPNNAQALTMKISMQGYSESKLENPMGFGRAQNDPIYEEQKAFNIRNFKEGRGYLKDIPFHNVEYLPVTCSHTFAAVNIAEGGCKGHDPKLCNEEGFIDKVKVLKLCPSWSKPMTDGIPCAVFRHELEAACPDLPAFLRQGTCRTTCTPKKRKCNSC